MIRHLANLAKKSRILLATLTLVTSFATIGAQPAAAFTPTLQSPGACLQANIANIPSSVQGLYRRTYTSTLIATGLVVTVPAHTYGINVGEVTVRRSTKCSTTEPQQVLVYRRVIGFGSGSAPQWTTLAERSDWFTLNPNYEGHLPAHEIFPTGSQMPNLHFDLDIRWFAANGTYLGRIWVSYDKIADYTCGSRPCSILSDPTFGAFVRP